MKEVILIKYGEIALKGNNRSYFEKFLEENLRKATLLGRECVKRERGRIYLIPSESEVMNVFDRASKVFGVHEALRALQVPKELSSIYEASRMIIKHVQPIKTFKVETRRSDKKFPYTSDKINELVGAYILEQFPLIKVNLKEPECTLGIEVRTDFAFIYLETKERQGYGGFPVGTAGRGLLLLSGGIDSPVAGWMAMKRGISIDVIHFHSFPFTGEKSKEKVFDLAKRLATWNLKPLRVIVAPFTVIQKHIVNNAHEGYWTILFRRSMHRIAEKIAMRDSYDTLVTGDNLSQVASQTLKNINTIDQATSIYILRPLISFDKLEIINYAKKIDTFTLSIVPHEDCCTVFTPSQPHTRSKPEQLLAIEEKLNLKILEDETISRIEII